MLCQKDSPIPVCKARQVHVLGRFFCRGGTNTVLIAEILYRESIASVPNLWQGGLLRFLASDAPFPRLLILRKTLGGVDLSAVDSLRGDVRSTTLVVASSDGVVRTLVGPVQRNCGLFAGLHEDTVLSIFEILGYRSSQVRCCMR